MNANRKGDKMTKLVKQFYKTKDGEVKLHCYKLTLPKEIVNKSNIDSENKINIKVENGKIIIERA